MTNWRRHVPWFPFLSFSATLSIRSCQNWRFAAPAWIGRYRPACLFALLFSRPFLRYSGLFCLMFCLYLFVGFVFLLLSLLFCVCLCKQLSGFSLSLWHSISQQNCLIISLFSPSLSRAAEVAPVCHLCVCECVCLKLYLSVSRFVFVCFASLGSHCVCFLLYNNRLLLWSRYSFDSKQAVRARHLGSVLPDCWLVVVMMVVGGSCQNWGFLEVSQQLSLVCVSQCCQFVFVLYFLYI